MDSKHSRKKNPNPRETANPLSAATLCYTLPTFFQGWRKELEVSDLYETFSEHRSSKLGDKIQKAWQAEEARAKRKNVKPSLRRTLVKIFGLEFMIYGIVLAVSEICIRLFQPIFLGKLVQFFDPANNETAASSNVNNSTHGLEYNGNATVLNGTDEIAQPLLLGGLISYYEPEQEIITKREAYLYAFGVVACSMINVFVTHPYMMGVLHVGMKIRVACCSLIYRKALKLSKSALGNTTAGQIVNLLSNDVNRFDVAVIFAHQLWVGPLETILITYFMYQEVGISAVIGVIFMLMFIPLQFFLGKKVAGLRLKTALRTDERVRLMNEIVSGIQVIKMYTWERPFAKLVSFARRYEIKTVRATSYIRGVVCSFIMFTTRIALFVTILAYVLFGYSINAKQVFVLTAFYNILRQSMTVFFPQGITQIAEANVSIKRLNKFLLYSETEVTKHIQQQCNGRSSVNYDKDKFELTDSHRHHEYEYAVNIENGNAKWSESSTENTLVNLNIKIKHGSLVAVIGTVGSGKSSLFHTILKELPLITGTLQVDGEISYASQEPWLFPGTVRQNILFGQPMDKFHYKTVIHKCALERDFTLLPYSDKTIVGERGISLSGGQRARINLARAVYKKADVYLLDDPLSAVDTHVGKQLFEGCIKNYLRDKTVILITHQLQYLKDVDQIILLEDGVITATGSFTELQESGLDFAKLLKNEIEQEEEQKQESKALARQLSLQRKSSIVSASSLDDKTIEIPDEVEEQKASGSISSFVYKAYLNAGANWCIIYMVCLLFVLAQLAASAGDYYITYWVNLEQKQSQHTFLTMQLNESYVNDGLLTFFKLGTNDTFGDLFDDLIPTTTTIPIKVRDSGDSSEFSRETSIYIYSAITVATIIATLVRSWAFFTVCMRASVRLHDRMFESISHAAMRFFNTNTSGRILNRFSKDMGAVDELLPAAMIDCLQIGLALVGIIIVVAIVNPWLMLPTLLIGVIFYFLRIFYLTTSRSIKRLEGVTRSPVFAYLNSSIQGLTTIRAYGAEAILEKEFDNHQDLHSSAWYLFLATSRAFGFWLDLVCIIYIAIVTLSFLVLGNEQFGGNVGLAITQSIGLTGMFQWGMRQSTELENQMTSVERIIEYNTVEHEPPLESDPDKKPPPSWPSKGQIKFVNLFLRYFPQDPPVLKNLRFTIQPLEKVGIVGRTGAGKSSLITALFRLSEIEGSIIIDDVDTKRLGLHDLRSKVSIIPQEPVLFSGTMRKNLDPFDEFSDEVLWKALEEVELKEAVADLVSGLNSQMSEGGSNFSVGQRQLVCLARAIIRNNKILVLDEATANVDPQTDALIQYTIRRKFANCTVLTIAHRLHTVMDSDKVLVMDAGTMVEFDHPHVLLENKNGYLYGMVQQTGKAMAEVLIKVAENSYKKLHAIGNDED